jgi:DegV family protein with EDD domain
VDQGYEVVHYSISDELSAMCQSAKKAAAQLSGVYVVDSRNLSTGIGLLVLYGCDLRDEGKSAKEIYDLSVVRTGAVQASFVVSTMSYLHKGGRCSSLSAVIASTLLIKPSIYVRNGKMGVGKKYFGMFDKVVPKYVDETLNQFYAPHKTRVFITHSSANPDIVANVRKKLEASGKFETILETVAGSTITSHCGKGTLGILYFNDGEKQ